MKLKNAISHVRAKIEIIPVIKYIFVFLLSNAYLHAMQKSEITSAWFAEENNSLQENKQSRIARLAVIRGFMEQDFAKKYYHPGIQCVTIIDAVKTGCMKHFNEFLVNQRHCIFASDPDGDTALHWAAYFNDWRTALTLLRAGAQWNTQNKRCEIPYNCFNFGTIPYPIIQEDQTEWLIFERLLKGDKLK